VIRVLLADDQTLVRAGFRAILESDDDIEVAGEAPDGTAAVALAERLLPDVVLMDIRMPSLDGIGATRQIASDARLANVRVLILTTFETDEYVFEALRAGASGFLVKDTEPIELLRAVRVVARGEALLAPSVTRRLIDEVVSQSSRVISVPGLTELTEREREIMVLVATGLSNDEIADHLTISPATVKTHASRIMAKIGARDRAQVVVFAHQAGLVRGGRAVSIVPL
jgi:DNA-binding NarL/FixJ family response regulator